MLTDFLASSKLPFLLVINGYNLIKDCIELLETSLFPYNQFSINSSVIYSPLAIYL
nr:MAG TPA: hypothetical protein [Bacteriophage sp.]